MQRPLQASLNLSSLDCHVFVVTCWVLTEFLFPQRVDLAEAKIVMKTFLIDALTILLEEQETAKNFDKASKTVQQRLRELDERLEHSEDRDSDQGSDDDNLSADDGTESM
jgi:hypothetical protein